MVGIYKITSPSNKIYIGQSWNIEERFRRYKTLKCQRQIKIHYSLLKHGPNNHKFDVIHQLPEDVSQDVMNEYEKLYIAQYLECGIELMNLQLGGYNGRHSEESKNKIRIANTGVIFSAERLRKMSEGNRGKPSPMKGKKMSDETKRKLSLYQTGRVMSEETKMKISKKLKGRIFSEQERKKISEALKGRKLSPDHLAKTRRKK